MHQLPPELGELYFVLIPGWKVTFIFVYTLSAILLGLSALGGIVTFIIIAAICLPLIGLLHWRHHKLRTYVCKNGFFQTDIWFGGKQIVMFNNMASVGYSYYRYGPPGLLFRTNDGQRVEFRTPWKNQRLMDYLQKVVSIWQPKPVTAAVLKSIGVENNDIPSNR